MDDSALDRLFSGDLDKLIPLPKRVVRLFISSTFTDMTLERNSLMERVYPRLKKYCRERHGLDFQVVDMRWGVRDEATDDHQTVNLCSREIDNCRRMSLGPNFVALLGDKYGFRPLCNRIKSSEYRALRRCLIELDMNTDFLDTWYKEDLNAVPPEYLLQPISSILKNFTNKKEPELQSIDQRIWQAIQERLHELLLIGSSRLVKQGRMSEKEQLMKYSISVTEREVIEGCLDVNEAKHHCLVYVRSILDLRTHLDECLAQLSHQQQLSATSSTGAGGDGSQSPTNERKDSATRKASLQIGDDIISLTTVSAATPAERRLEKTRKLIAKYIDLRSKDNNWKLDENAQEALSNLKEVKLAGKLKLNGRNLNKYKVLWNEQDGISLKSDEHKHYLNELCEHFYTNLTRMIRKASKNEQEFKSGLIGEVLQHSHYAKHVSKTFHGRSEELDKISAYILSSNNDSGLLPMFIYGVGGSGKTSILARASTLAREWIYSSKSKQRAATSGATKSSSYVEEERWDQKACIIMRFCCTTPSSSSMVGVLTSVCRQLQFNFYQFGPLNGVVNHNELGGKTTIDDGGDFQLPYKPIPEDFVRLIFTFRQLLDNCQHRYHRERLFVIILDSVEHLTSPAECSVEVKYSWLTSIARLPPNVRLIVSCSSERAASGRMLNGDYLHLKRHFLQTYFAYTEQRLLFKGVEPNNDTYTSMQDHYHRGRVSNNSSKSGSINDISERYHLLKRVMLPAIRLMRRLPAEGNKSPTNDETRSIEREQTKEVNYSELSVLRAATSSSSSGWSLAAAVSSRRRKSSLAQFQALPLALVNSAKGSSLQTNKQQQKQQVASNSNKLVLLANQGDETNIVIKSENSSDDLSPNDNESQGFSGVRGELRGVWILHVRPMGVSLALKVIQRWLNECSRILTQQQWSLVEKSFVHCSRPIFVKLAFGELVNWKSYSVQSDIKGLTFGSSLLNNNGEDEEGGVGKISFEQEKDPVLAKLLADSKDIVAPAGEFKWQILSMEQQWLNYLDYKQRKEQTECKLQRVDGSSSSGGGGGGGKRGATKQQQQQQQQREDGTVIIRIGALSNSRSTNTIGIPTSTCRLSNTIDDAICQLFARIELQHGYVLTKHSLSYITAARNGICENELEDILSLDDVVLDDVFQYHLPPVRRIPPLLWTRIRNDLPDYLSERDADGIVVNWHHSQFKLVAQKRYLSDQSQVYYIHSNLADYFLGKWADKAKPFRCTKQQVQMAAEQLESAVQRSMRDQREQQSIVNQTQQQQQQNVGVDNQQQKVGGYIPQRTSVSGLSRLGGGVAYSGSGSRPGASFSVRSRLRSSDQHDQRLQWMQAKADRRVPHQPLYYSSSSSNNNNNNNNNNNQLSGLDSSDTSQQDAASTKQQQIKPSKSGGGLDIEKKRYNLRKLTELPYHLMKSGRFFDLANEVLFNYKWLFAALDALGLQALLADFNEASRAIEEALRQLESPINVENDENSEATNNNNNNNNNIYGEFNTTELNNQTNKLQIEPLRSMLKQLDILNNTIRLSCSAIHSDTQMLAPQLIGRLLPLVKCRSSSSKIVRPTNNKSTLGGASMDHNNNNHSGTKTSFDQVKYLIQLLDQCDKDGCSDNSLLPIDHCLQSPDGLQLSSLEGHSFAIMSMAMAADQRHLLAVSNRFIMWDISTGQVSRDIDPKIGGSIMRELKMGLNNEYAIAYTSENVILLLDILTQQVTKFDEFTTTTTTVFEANENENNNNTTIREGDKFLGLNLIDKYGATRFSVWTSKRWFVLRVINNERVNTSLLKTQQVAASMPQRISIELEYCVDLFEDMIIVDQNQSSSKILNVQQVSAQTTNDNLFTKDLTFVQLTHKKLDDGMLSPIQLISIDCLKGPMGWMCRVWKQKPIEARSLSLDPFLKQLIFSHPITGDIYLSRRRSTCWSRPKLIRTNLENKCEFDGEASLIAQLNSMVDGRSLSRRHNSRVQVNERRLAASQPKAAALIPMAIELNSSSYYRRRDDDDDDNSFVTSFETIDPFISGTQKRAEIVEFERQIDSLDNYDNGSDKIDENCVFIASPTTPNGNEVENTSKRATNSMQATKFVKLYYHNKIVILRLGVSAAATAATREKSLLLPRSIRNISVEPNKCQIKSIILEGTTVDNSDGGISDYLVVAIGRRLLLYSINNEQFLKSIDAHGARIVQLLPVRFKQTTTNDLNRNDNKQTNSQQSCFSKQQQFVIKDQNLTIASASMDKTVKIWNLANLNKDVFALDKLENSIESMSLTNQKPLAACLARGELGIWDWRTLKLIARITSADLINKYSTTSKSHDDNDEKNNSHLNQQTLAAPNRIISCKFSSNDQFLCLATLDTIHLMSIPDTLNLNSNKTQFADQKIDFKIKFSRPLPSLSTMGFVRKLFFFLQDSRLLAIVECSSSQQCARQAEDNNDEDSSTTTEAHETDTWRLYSRLLILCYSIPDGRLLYKIDISTPTLPQQQQLASGSSNYFDSSATNSNKTTATTSVSHNKKSQQGSSSSSSENRHAKVRLPIITRDHLHIVTVETLGSDNNKDDVVSYPIDSSRLLAGDKSNRLRRKSSVASKLTLTLNVYSTRDGCLVRTINLNQLELYNSGASMNLLDQHHHHHHQSHSQLQLQHNNSNRANYYQNGRSTTASMTPVHVPAQVSIGSDQFSRLKAVSYRERNSIVALIDDERGSSYLIDVSSKQLMSCSNTWNGKLSSDGRYGLSRMFKSSAAGSFHRNTSAAAATAAAAAAASERNETGTGTGTRAGNLPAHQQATLTAAAFASGGAGGLQLLEMSHGHSVKPLLTNETISRLSGFSSGASVSTSGSSHDSCGVANRVANEPTTTTTQIQSAPGSDTDITCGFTRPNDNYVYYYDLRLKRLLLIRVRDGQLISNYKLSSQVTKIRCSNDGYALILGLADGSLTSLAIVDPQKSDTLLYLAQYPSRTRTTTA